jgi:hypothetical protein
METSAKTPPASANDCEFSYTNIEQMEYTGKKKQGEKNKQR